MVIASCDVTCRHHWRIDEPEGRYSAGTCTLCGATRQFDNAFVADLRTRGWSEFYTASAFDERRWLRS